MSYVHGCPADLGRTPYGGYAGRGRREATRDVRGGQVAPVVAAGFGGASALAGPGELQPKG
jgi:hypothetical protein